MPKICISDRVPGAAAALRTAGLEKELPHVNVGDGEIEDWAFEASMSCCFQFTLNSWVSSGKSGSLGLFGL